MTARPSAGVLVGADWLLVGAAAIASLRWVGEGSSRSFHIMTALWILVVIVIAYRTIMADARATDGRDPRRVDRVRRDRERCATALRELWGCLGVYQGRTIPELAYPFMVKAAGIWIGMVLAGLVLQALGYFIVGFLLLQPFIVFVSGAMMRRDEGAS